jgi:hypothetical protein
MQPLEQFDRQLTKLWQSVLFWHAASSVEQSFMLAQSMQASHSALSPVAATPVSHTIGPPELDEATLEEEVVPLVAATVDDVVVEPVLPPSPSPSSSLPPELVVHAIAIAAIERPPTIQRQVFIF